jgi:hypothetical protein
MQEVALGGLRSEPQRQLRRIAQELKQSGAAAKRFRPRMSRPLTPRTKRERMPGGSVVVSSGVASIGSSRYYSKNAKVVAKPCCAFHLSREIVL